MNPSRRVLLRDLFLGVGGLTVVGQHLVGRIEPRHAVIVAASAVAFAGLQYCSEHGLVPGPLLELRDALRERPAVAFLVTVTAAAAAVAPVLAARSLVDAYLGVFVGVFLGSLAYRTLYGVVWPVPEPAVGRA